MMAIETATIASLECFSSAVFLHREDEEQALIAGSSTQSIDK
jgi:hypothetical protein